MFDQGLSLDFAFLIVVLQLNLLFQQFLLQLVQGLNGGAGLKLELYQLLVLFINVLNKLFVFNLQLMEIDKLEVVAHLILVLDVSLGLQNLAS